MLTWLESLMHPFVLITRFPVILFKRIGIRHSQMHLVHTITLNGLLEQEKGNQIYWSLKMLA